PHPPCREVCIPARSRQSSPSSRSAGAATACSSVLSPSSACGLARPSRSSLTPPERSSADHTRRGHISKQGSRWLRWVMVEAAVRALGNPQLGVFYTSIEKRRGSKIARVALARRLLTLAYYALRDEGGCRAFPV